MKLTTERQLTKKMHAEGRIFLHKNSWGMVRRRFAWLPIKTNDSKFIWLKSYYSLYTEGKLGGGLHDGIGWIHRERSTNVFSFRGNRNHKPGWTGWHYHKGIIRKATERAAPYCGR